MLSDDVALESKGGDTDESTALYGGGGVDGMHKSASDSACSEDLGSISCEGRGAVKPGVVIIKDGPSKSPDPKDEQEEALLPRGVGSSARGGARSDSPDTQDKERE